jgi:hypothetical protein
MMDWQRPSRPRPARLGGSLAAAADRGHCRPCSAIPGRFSPVHSFRKGDVSRLIVELGMGLILDLNEDRGEQHRHDQRQEQNLIAAHRFLQATQPMAGFALDRVGRCHRIWSGRCDPGHEIAVRESAKFSESMLDGHALTLKQARGPEAGSLAILAVARTLASAPTNQTCLPGVTLGRHSRSLIIMLAARSNDRA